MEKNKIRIENLKLTLNDGFDKVRLIMLVKVGSLIRLKPKIAQVTLRDNISVLVINEIIMEIKGIERLIIQVKTLSLCTLVSQLIEDTFDKAFK